MGDRTLVLYTESDKAEHPYRLRIERSSAGAPQLFFTIINELEEEATIIVDDGNELLRPVLAWLQHGVIPNREGNSWLTEQKHEDCEQCEHAVELAIQDAQQKRIDSSYWNIMTPSTTFNGSAIHNGRVRRA